MDLYRSKPTYVRAFKAYDNNGKLFMHFVRTDESGEPLQGHTLDNTTPEAFAKAFDPVKRKPKAKTATPRTRAPRAAKPPTENGDGAKVLGDTSRAAVMPSGEKPETLSDLLNI